MSVRLTVLGLVTVSACLAFFSETLANGHERVLTVQEAWSLRGGGNAKCISTAGRCTAEPRCSEYNGTFCEGMVEYDNINGSIGLTCETVLDNNSNCVENNSVKCMQYHECETRTFDGDPVACVLKAGEDWEEDTVTGPSGSNYTQTNCP